MKYNSGLDAGQNSQSYPAVNSCYARKQPIKSNKWNAQLPRRFIRSKSPKKKYIYMYA